ncbi:hypothetical protein [Actinoplanes sp. NPDC051494]|uniref:hypothetical protein n=1 Tax=Actinoplanes sp. NPDC051494 TaxID=3363907 RepID=UPI0037B3C74F
MSDPYPVRTHPAGTTSDTGGVTEQAKQVAGESARAAGEAAGDVKDTARHQAQRVTHEAKTQARGVASDVKQRVSTEARTQSDRLSGSIRDLAGQLDEMRGDRSGTPAAAVVGRVADGGRQVADYLDHHGPDGVLREVGAFARRRPGAFLAGALAAGFVIGRLGKGVMQADEAGKPGTDAFTSTNPAPAPRAEYVRPAYDTPGYDSPGYLTPGYNTAGTDYASTGTGTPVVVTEEYPR